MLLPKQKIVLLFRYIWLLLAVGIILYIAQQNIVIERQIDYEIDLSQLITRDIEGPYPAHRVSLNPDNTLAVLAEPLYLQVYTPAKFKTLQVNGLISLDGETARLGLKQADGSWDWQDIDNDEVNLIFDLANASVKANKLELIFSFPELNTSGKIVIKNLGLTLDR